MHNITYLLCIVLLSLLACNDTKYDTKAIAQEVKNRQVKRLTEPKLLQWIKRKGNEIVPQAQKHLLRHLYKMQNEQPQASLKNLLAQTTWQQIPALDSLQKQYLCQIQWKVQASNQEAKAFFSADKTQVFYQQPLILDNQIEAQWLLTFDKKTAIWHIKPKEIQSLY